MKGIEKVIQANKLMSEFIALNEGEPCILKAGKSNSLADNQTGHTVTIKPKQSELELMKEKYSTGNYVCYTPNANNGWFQVNQSADKTYWLEGTTYKLIHKDHAHIAEAVAKDSSVEVEKYITSEDELGKDLYEDVADFFESYDKDNEYRMRRPTKDLTNYRIKVTPDTKDEIEGLIRKEGYSITTIRSPSYGFTSLLAYDRFGNKFIYINKDDVPWIQGKPMYLHNHELVFEPKEECECDHDFLVVDHDDYKFCPYCGKPLVAPIEKE